MLATIAPCSLATAQDQVVVEQASTADAAVLGLYGKTSGEPCRNNWYLLDGGPVTVGDMVPSSACAAEATVFAQHRALAVTGIEWTQGDDEIHLQMGASLRQIEVDVYVVAGGERADDWARTDLGRARTVFDENRAGLTFIDGNFRSSSSLSADEIAAIGNDCTQVEELKGRASLYNDERINVYFVYAIGGDWEETPRGRNCIETHPPGNIIYISTYRHTPTTLSHELGHAFGLRGAAGHTGEGPSEESEEEVYIPGFESVNIMWTWVDADQARAKNHFSLGQVFRMSADESSWLNRKGQSPGGPSPRHCHPSGVDNESPCPPLAFDITTK